MSGTTELNPRPLSIELPKEVYDATLEALSGQLMFWCATEVGARTQAMRILQVLGITKKRCTHPLGFKHLSTTLAEDTTPGPASVEMYCTRCNETWTMVPA